MVNLPKHCWNLTPSTFVKFIDHWPVKWVRKRLSYWHAKSWDCLLTHWLPMKSILFLIEAFLRYQFRCSYFRHKNLCLSFLLHYWNLDEILNILKENVTLVDFVFPKLRTPKRLSDKCLKSPVSDNSSARNMVNVPKHCWNPHHSTITTFIDHHQVNWVGISLSYWPAKSWNCLLTHCQLMKSIPFLIEEI